MDIMGTITKVPKKRLLIGKFVIGLENGGYFWKANFYPFVICSKMRHDNIHPMIDTNKNIQNALCHGAKSTSLSEKKLDLVKQVQNNQNNQENDRNVDNLNQINNNAAVAEQLHHQIQPQLQQTQPLQQLQQPPKTVLSNGQPGIQIIQHNKNQVDNNQQPSVTQNSSSGSGKKSFGSRNKEKAKSIFTRKKNKPKNNNPSNSYPKQQYKPTNTNTGKIRN